jgi:transposase
LRGLRSAPRGRPASTVTEPLVEALLALIGQPPRVFGYLRSTWSSELLAQVLVNRHGLVVHASTVRCLLPKLGWGWRRARPTLYKRDPRKAQRLAAIAQALADNTPGREVFYVDEVDIELNPRIGFQWQRRGHQHAVATPGQNRKHYIAGALHAHTGKLVWTAHERKNTALFLDLLRALRRTYRRARQIVLMLDNYIIRRSQLMQRWMAANPKFQLCFQPAYHPWVNVTERLWKQLHQTLTRNHCCQTLTELLRDTARFFTVIQPFPGAGHGVAQYGSAI